MAKVMMKLGTVPGLSKGKSMLPASLQSSISVIGEALMQSPGEKITSLSSKNPEQMAQVQIKAGDSDIESAYKHNTTKGKPPGISFGRKKVFVLQNPAFKGGQDSESAGHSQSENIVLQTILVKELKVHPSESQTSNLQATAWRHEDIIWIYLYFSIYCGVPLPYTYRSINRCN
ncbi:hypothetical protein MKX03_017706 [Papaver bracteatum]|nr:hypothetical protein MKX03_017706 [Papaver bracteatum]